MDALDPRHGTTAGHMAHRTAGEPACAACVAAKSRYEKVRQVYGDRMVPAIGTRRRIHALMALGHSGADIAKRLGVTYQAVHRIEHSTSERIWVRTAANVARVYGELSMTRPTGPHSNRIRAKAAERGYVVPLAWDDIDHDPEPPAHEPADDVDPVVVHRLVRGEWTLPATRAERTEAVRRWVASGRSLRSLRNESGWKPERYLTVGEDAA